MPLTDNFLIATNTGLTIEFGGYEDLDHKTDESDNPQDLPPLYIGAIDTGVKLQAESDPGIDNITLTPTDILAKWQASTAYTLNQMLQPVTPNGYRYECTTAGTTGASQPTWPTTVGSTVTNGTCIFTCKSPKHALTEVILATSAPDLDTNTPGGALSLGNTINGGTGNKVTIYIRVNNGVNIVSNNTSAPEIGLKLNSLVESTI